MVKTLILCKKLKVEIKLLYLTKIHQEKKLEFFDILLGSHFSFK